MNCHYCQKNPKTKGIVWNGFLDRDMNINVCWKCQDKHYKEKQKTEHKGLYSEFPVVIPKQQLELF